MPLSQPASSFTEAVMAFEIDELVAADTVAIPFDNGSGGLRVKVKDTEYQPTERRHALTLERQTYSEEFVAILKSQGWIDVIKR
jgi:hypothetical protein